MRKARACFCIDLSVYGIMIGVICILGSLACFIGSLVVFCTIDQNIVEDTRAIRNYDLFAADDFNEYAQLKQQKITDKIDENAYDELLVYGMSSSICILIASICLTVGVIVRNHKLLLPWLLAGLATILANCFQLFYILYDTDHLPTTYIYKMGGIFLAQCVILGFNVQFWLSILRLYIEIKSDINDTLNYDDDDDDWGLRGYSRLY